MAEKKPQKRCVCKNIRCHAHRNLFSLAIAFPKRKKDVLKLTQKITGDAEWSNKHAGDRGMNKISILHVHPVHWIVQNEDARGCVTSWKVDLDSALNNPQDVSSGFIFHFPVDYRCRYYNRSDGFWYRNFENNIYSGVSPSQGLLPYTDHYDVFCCLIR